MGAKLRYAVVAAGGAVAFVGALQTWYQMQELDGVLLWALVALAGLFLAAHGAMLLLTDTGSEATARPENATRRID